jgi:hypothetical protein
MVLHLYFQAAIATLKLGTVFIAPTPTVVPLPCIWPDPLLEYARHNLQGTGKRGSTLDITYSAEYSVGANSQREGQHTMHSLQSTG